MGNLEFIKGVSGTNVGYVSLTDCFTDEYDVYKFFVYYKAPSETSCNLQFLGSGGSVITTAAYYYGAQFVQAGVGMTKNIKGTNLTYIPYLGYSESNYSSYSQGYIYNPRDTNTITHIHSDLSGDYNYGPHSNARYLQTNKQIGGFAGPDLVTGLRIFNVATVNDIEVKVWGVF